MSMKPTKNNLDDFFAAARSEEPILSEESVRDLIGKRELMQQHSNPSFFTTKGFIMTSIIGFSAASIVAISMLGSSTPAPVQQTPSVAPVSSSVPSVIIPKVTEPKKSTPTNVRTEVVVQPVTPVKPVSPIEPSGFFAPKEIKAITPIAAKESDLPALGITREADGGVAFYMKGNTPKTYYKSIVPATTWGLMLSDKPDLAESEMSVSTKLTPTLITDARGNRRMIIYDNDNSSLHMSHSHHGNTDSNYEDNVTVQYAKNTNDSANRKMIIVNKIERKTINHNSDPASLDDIVIDGHPDGKIVLKNKMVQNDSIDFGQIENLIKQYTNSDQLKEAMEVLNNLKINHKDKKLSISIGDDSINTNGISLHGKINMSVQIDDQDENPSIDDIMINDKPIFQEIDEQIKNLDDLVPVLVRTATTTTFNQRDNTTYDNGVIFWFKHTPELDKALNGSTIPAAVTDHTPTTNKFLPSVLIHPNPTPDQAVLRFTLNEPRTLSFAIHDILGKRVADLGMNEYSSAGEFSRELSLGNIAPGIYLLVIASDKGEQQIERIVVSR